MGAIANNKDFSANIALVAGRFAISADKEVFEVPYENKKIQQIAGNETIKRINRTLSEVFYLKNLK